MPKHLSVTAHRGDAKTLLAFDLPKRFTKNLAGFTIQCKPPDKAAYYLHNSLRFEKPADHAQAEADPAHSSINAPFQKFRWLHVLGAVHQGLTPAFGRYTYTVTPRYFKDGSLLPLDASLAQSVRVEVAPFTAKKLQLGFTRGYVQSQAFVHHFGHEARIRPAHAGLLFDTTQLAGTNAFGEKYTYADEYRWMGYTARQRVLDMLDEVLADKSLRLDVFAYDLDEPTVMEGLLALAKQGRIRIILDNAALHHSKTKPKDEDEFETKFRQAAGAGPAAIMRGKFGRYSHHKVFIVRPVNDAKPAVKVLAGSTNFSITGLYVNANHVLVFNDPAMATQFAEVFDEAWQQHVKRAVFAKSELAAKEFHFSNPRTPDSDVTFSPHQEKFAEARLSEIAERTKKEAGRARGSVLFAVMQLARGTGPVFPALAGSNGNGKLFSYGISDSPGGVALYAPGHKTGVLVTGKPTKVRLPKPFDQVPGIGLIHEIHHKFVVCGFNRRDAVVYCGSSNLALGGEQENGDNLFAIHDQQIATAFAIEAVALVDHYAFLDRRASAKGKKTVKPPTNKQQAAEDAHWFLRTHDAWARSYYDRNDLHYMDRKLFA